MLEGSTQWHSCTRRLPQFPAERTRGSADPALAAARFTGGSPKALLEMGSRELPKDIQEENSAVRVCSTPCRDLPVCHNALSCLAHVLFIISFF